MAVLGVCCLWAASTNAKLGRDDVGIEELQRDDPFGSREPDGDAESGEIRIAQPMRHRNGRMRIGQLRRGGGHRTRHSKHGEFALTLFFVVI